MERSVLKLPLSKLCAVPFALQNGALFERETRGEKVPRKGRIEGRPEKGAKMEKGRAQTSQLTKKTYQGRKKNHDSHRRDRI